MFKLIANRFNDHRKLIETSLKGYNDAKYANIVVNL